MLMHLSTAVEIAARGGPLAELAIADVAHLIREKAGLRDPKFSTHELIDANFPDVLVVGRDLPPGVHGALERTSDGPVIVYSRDLESTAQRHAIMHEVGHLIFDGECAARRPGRNRNSAAEHRADHFADESLVPLAKLRVFVRCWPSAKDDRDLYLDQLDALASRFAVPTEVVDRQLRSLEWATIRHG
jgi:Zn-dependent peptidase ImmA (M78 family)